MKKSYKVIQVDKNMRADRWIRKTLGKLPQGLIEKFLRNGKIKINQKKIKSSYKVNIGDNVDVFDFDFKILDKKKIKNSNHLNQQLNQMKI